jgi:tRNA A22 N-methylase
MLRKYLYNNGFEIKREIAVLENGKLYSVMLVFFTGESQTKPEFFYFVGLVDKDTEYGKLYIEKQLNRCQKCAKSLEFVPDKSEDYLYYKNIVSGIEKHLKL